MLANKLFFSVIIPTFNRASLIGITVNSVINQKFDNWELIIVDDGSTDNTSEIISSFSDDRIRYIKTENRERGAARNTGIFNAKGKYIAFLDSDDYFLPDHLSTAASIINDNPEITFFHLNFEFRDSSGKLVMKSSNLPSVLNASLVGTNVISCAGVIMKTILASEYLFCENRTLSGTEDYELWLRIAASIKIYHFPQVTTVIVDHETRSMAELNVSKVENRILLFLELSQKNQKVIEFLGTQWPFFCSNRYSYISLHAALAGNVKISLKYWFKAFMKYPLFCFSTRSFSIIKNIIVNH